MTPRFLLLGLLALTGALGEFTARAQNATQTLALRPGWNAIHLEVEPADADPSQVFRGLPIESVWTYASKLTSVEFIQDPNEPLWNRSSWRMWVPTNRVESFNNNLYKILGNRPYLVNVSGGAAANLTISGRPAFRPLGWVPDTYNLRGFAIDPASPPTFVDFFRPSDAHYDSATAQLQKIYRLNTLGQWQRVGPTDLMEPGIAYWVFTRGGSDFLGPFGLQVLFGDGLDFAGSLNDQSFTLENRSGISKQVEITDVSGGLNTPLAIPVRGANGESSWTSLPQPYRITLAAGEKQEVLLTLQRQKMTTTNFSTLLAITDHQGSLFRVPVTAKKFVGVGSDGSSSASPAQEARNHAGLWVGTVTLNAVSEVNSGRFITNLAAGFTAQVTTNEATGQPVTTLIPNQLTRVGISTNPAPTRSGLSMHLLLHVDTNGVTQLLKEVIQMWKDGTSTNAGGGLFATATPGRFVLLTEDSLIPQFKGAGLRDGLPVGRRLSTASYDWDGTNSSVAMTGRFAVNNLLTCSLKVQPNTPTNPFRHKYHPDHDNLNARYDGPSLRPEAYAVTRDIALVLAPSDTQASAADYGYSVIAGTYQEKFTGLHKEPLYVNGTFRLTRVATTGVLNQ